MTKIYICSPCRGRDGDYERNIENAATYARIVARMGYMPVAPHVYFTRFLSDTVPAERELGLKLGLEALKECAEVWVFGLDAPSEGMQKEIELAQLLNIPVRDGFKMIYVTGE